MSTLTWRAPARTSVSGGAKWAPTECVEVHHFDGDAVVRIESWPVTDGADLDVLVAEHLQTAPDTPGWHDHGSSTVPVLGRDGRQRTVSWTDEAGTTMVATLRYQLDHGRAVVLTSIAAEADPDKVREAEEIVSSVTTGSLFSAEAGTPALRTAVADFADVATRWGNPSPVRPGPAVTVTNEEALAAGRQWGRADVPGTDPLALDHLTAEQADLVLSVAWRALIARGLESDQMLREPLDIATDHDLIVTVTRGGAVREWLAARPDRLVQITPDAVSGMVTLTARDTADLVDLIVREPGEITVEANYRAGQAIAGGVATGDGSDPEFRRQIIDLLPGK